MVTNNRFQNNLMEARHRVSMTSPSNESNHLFMQRNGSSSMYHTNQVNSTVPLNWRQVLGKVLGDQHMSLSTKCNEVEKICCSLTSKEMVEAFPYLVSDIFELNGSNNWYINKLESRRHPYDFNVVRQFLSPNGPLFRIINNLSMEQEVKFQFPITSFPMGILELFEKNTVPVVYGNKISLLTMQQGFANFDAFEYYFVLFAQYITNQNTKGMSSTTGGEDSLYVQLVEDYFQYYFPTNALLSTNETNNVKFIDTPQTVMRPSRISSKFSLWKSPELVASPQSNWAPYTSTLGNVNTDSKSETFLQLITDFWLCINPQDHSRRRNPIKLPSTDHARVVRVLVKYFHMYMNAGQQKQQSFISESAYQMQMTDMKKSSAFMIIHRKLYPFLKDCFANWPLDGSFRMVMETWLSYIQPWRYTSLSETSLNESSNVDVSVWSEFITENNQFYTQLFKMFINRALRMEMKSTSSMQLVYRVAKVYAQSNFANILRQVVNEESNTSQKLSMSTHISNSGSLFATTMGYNNSNLSNFLDGNANIFDEGTMIQVQSLCESLASTCIELRKNQMRMKQNFNGNRLLNMWQQIKDFFMMEGTLYDDDQDDDERRLLEYLEHSCSMFCHIFEFPCFQTHPSPNQSSTNVDKQNKVNDFDLPRPNLVVEDDGKTPEFIMTKNGVKLTELGREQILRRQRHFEFCESWDREYESLKPYESLQILNILQQLSSKINEKFSSQLYSIYNRENTLSRTLRKISKEVENTRFVNCQIKIPRHRVDLSEVKPRISLRFASSYYFLGYIFWTAVFARLFGFSWLSIIILLTIVFFVCIVVHIDSPPRIMQDE